ncbi:hypothetical protein C343_05632 [Cryptococcus neoformans C23]|uniref:G-protein coupled receptors family 1 profile domain-containing protein n=1 Tax=Cryptococcus neoformans (strain H99 / ATCC 208821 / CBS 10515 / FGSC 9487) TaxID=235443 RepID=J9VY03_CRYN9|nr:hypothetical protein CNAG_04730 [Cryptococcus neoformans var. grubii H99]AFR97489.1 hypothetical protein CNAG_04730 [Cryptococcus neoformans var. grubii H99]AUB27516.1 hypothetical protein CKF44_04730 [Cryptococcus neoformans var. grubii]OWZ40409.1 hypothetical protein C343_05632 [Cryptococcus neoformans var. grubii C23]OXG35590.1 hypothetical protein C359_05497 [Cryptococcus neoformans var. grubii Bt120]|eukprot:XP_012052168.1 hypothetical protein CNAG_04730 [Cryptococcus neoformans var. grubii H99]
MPSLLTRIEEWEVIEKPMLHQAMGRDKIALAPQTTPLESDRWMVIVNVVILCLTVLGAGMILSSMAINEFVFSRPGTTRTRIVQALIVSDLLLGIIGLISSGLTLTGDGHLMAHGTTSCSGLGFMLTAILWSEHLWTLLLAFVTYMILINPLHSMTLWLEKKWFYFYIIVWVIAIMMGLIGYEVYGFYPAGGICFYGNNTGLYAELIQFIPRAIVCLTITILYSRLIVFLRRPDKIRAKSGSTTGYSNEIASDIRQRSRLLPFTNPFRRNRASTSSTPQANQNAAIATISGETSESSQPAELIKEKDARPISAFAGKSWSLPTSPTSMPANMADLPPWERIELPAFQIDGEKFGGPAIAVGSGSSLWSGWKGLGGRKRPSTGSSMVSPQLQEAPRFGSISSNVDDGTFSPREVAGELKASAQTLVGPQMEIIASGDNPEAPRDYSSSISPLSENVIDDVPRKRHRRANFQGTVTDSSWCTHKMSSHRSFTPSNLSRSDKSSALETHRPSVATVIDSIESIQTPKKLSVPSIAFDNDAFIPAVEQLPTAQSQPMRPLSPIFSQSAPSSRSRSSSQPRTTLFSNPKSLHSRQHTLSGPDIGTSSAPAALEDDDLDEEMDLMKMLAAAPPKVDDRFAPPPGEQYELVPESMSSYLNRKTAMLMLWFPLGYLLLFSVSFVRIIYDFCGRPPHALRAISRWFILAQGLLDAIIYGVVEWHTKRVVRKRVRRGTFSPHHSSTGSRVINSTARVVNNITSRMTHSRGNGSGGGFGTDSATAINSENLPGDSGRGSHQAGQTMNELRGGHVTNGKSGLDTRPRNGEKLVLDEKQKSGNGEVPSEKS